MALIVGHSQAKYMHQYIEDYNITTLSYPGSRIDQLWPRIEELVPYFRVIAILIGANDIQDGNSFTVLKKLQTLCEKIHEENPRAQVLVSHILPRVQSRFANQRHEPSFLNHFNYTAYDVNSVLCKVASLQPWIECVKFPMFVQDGVIQKHLLSRDGLHLSFQGTSYVASVIRETVLRFLCAEVSSTAETETATQVLPLSAKTMSIEYPTPAEASQGNLTSSSDIHHPTPLIADASYREPKSSTDDAYLSTSARNNPTPMEGAEVSSSAETEAATQVLPLSAKTMSIEYPTQAEASQGNLTSSSDIHQTTPPVAAVRYREPKSSTDDAYLSTSVRNNPTPMEGAEVSSSAETEAATQVLPLSAKTMSIENPTPAEASHGNLTSSSDIHHPTPLIADASYREPNSSTDDAYLSTSARNNPTPMEGAEVSNSAETEAATQVLPLSAKTMSIEYPTPAEASQGNLTSSSDIHQTTPPVAAVRYREPMSSTDDANLPASAMFKLIPMESESPIHFTHQKGGGNSELSIKQGDSFTSYDEFKNKFDTWCASNGYPMKVGGSEKLANSTPAFPYKSLRFLCKHYGKPRIRSEAKRPVQQYLPSGCEAILRLNLDSSGKNYKITKLVTEHNHSISPQTLPMYSSNRTLNTDEVEEIKPFLEMNVETKILESMYLPNSEKVSLTKTLIM